MRQVFICSVLLASLIASHSLFAAKKASEAPSKKVVEAQSVTTGSITQTIHLIGTVRAKQSTQFVAKTHGTFHWMASPGQQVKKGFDIACLENTDLKQQLALAIASEKLAHAQHVRTQQLLKTNAVSKHVAEKAEHEWLTAQTHLTAAQIALDQTRFVAPFDGTVGIYKLPQGAQVTQGTPVVAFYNPMQLEIIIDVPGSYVHQLKDNQRVYVDQKQYTLKHIEKIIDPQTHMTLAYFDYPNQNAIIGSQVDVELVVADRSNTIVIPYEALFLKKGNSVVYVVEDNEAALRFVTPGVRQKDKIEIVEGLEAGEQLILRGQARLYPYEAVQVASS